ncbi:hypothetical protein D3C73_1622900 [compost metagenome]
MPPYSTGLVMPRKPRLPIFLNSSCAGNTSAASHSSTKGSISADTKRRMLSMMLRWSSV